MQKRKIVLASSSPRRRELLEYTGLSFIIDPPDIEENMQRKLSPRVLAKTLALEKGLTVAARHSDAIILAADTIVAIGKYRWSKPGSERDARFMLRTLSGKTHEVWTGFAIIDTASGRRFVDAVKTRITLLPFSKKNIERHVRSGEALKGAGGYMIQKSGAVFIERIDGDYTNVVGLSLPSVLAQLKKFGVKA